MKIKNLNERKGFWSSKVKGSTARWAQTPIGVNNYLSYYDGKEILEIGPGEGRQFNFICDSVKYFNYNIADISLAVLDLPVYQKTDKFLLSDYLCDLEKKFDIIHFWYVVHHILPPELPSFFSFVHRHLKPDGFAIFNYQCVDDYHGGLASDGMKTTDIPLLSLENIINKFFTTVEHKKLTHTKEVVCKPVKVKSNGNA